MKQKKLIQLGVAAMLSASMLTTGCSNNTEIETTKNTKEAVPMTTTPAATSAEELGEYDTPTLFATKQAGITYGTIETISYDSKTTQSTRQCNVLLPPDYDETKSYPVLYLLHGIGGTHTEWLGGSPANIIGNLIASGEAQEMIVVMPNVRAMANDSVPADVLSQENIDAFDNFINDLRDDLMPYIESHYAVKTGRENTAIAGLSMGGRESLYIGFTMLDTFGYIGAFSPAPGLLPYSQLGYTGQLTEAEFTVPEGSPTPKLVLICNGENDNTVGTVPTTYHEALVKNNVEHIWYTIPGDHDFTVWKNGLYNFAKRIFQ
jgi:enterochelin esterase-like enzyme